MSKGLGSRVKVQDSKGFTLIEVMVASLILATVVGAMAGIFILASRQSSLTSNKTAALYHANETLKMLSSYVADEPFAAPEDDGEGANGWFEAAQRQPGWQGCADANSDGYADAGGDCYVLSGGAAPGANHWRTQASLPADFTAVGGKVNYQVTNGTPAAGWKKVVVKVSWTEPQ